MNIPLKVYIKSNPEKVLTQVQEHSEVSTRLMSTDMAVSYLDHFRLIQHFKNSDKSAEMATMLAISGSAEFNFIAGHHTGDAHIARLDDITADTDVIADTSTKTIDGNELTLAQRLTAFKQAVMVYCKTTAYPFADTTQEEFDAAKAALDIEGETIGVVSYDAVDSAQMFHVRSNANKTQIEIALNEAVAYDTTFKIYCSTKSGLNDTWVELPTPVASNISLKSGQLACVQVLEQFHARHTRYRVVSNRKDEFKALVTSIAKY
jgi:hypothetical protein